jgi:cold shock CspA family protein
MPTGKNKGKNIFFRDSAVCSTDPKTIRQGQFVCFEIIKNIRSISLTAVNVQSFQLPLTSRRDIAGGFDCPLSANRRNDQSDSG